MMKAEFMSLWDGLTTDEDVRIVVSSLFYFISWLTFLSSDYQLLC